jgi:excisionase family DNA binding protein
MLSDPAVAVTADPTQVGTLYTTADVSRLLRVHQRTVQQWIRTGMLPAVRYGRILRIRQADLVAFGEVLNPPAPATDPTPAPVAVAPE